MMCYVIIVFMYYHKWGNLLEVRAQDGDVL